MQYKRTNSHVVTILLVAAIAVLGGWEFSRGQDGSAEKPGLEPLATVSGWDDWVVAAEFSADGSLLVAGSYDVVKLIDTETFEVTATVDTGSGFAKAVCFSPDGTSIAVGGYQTIQLIDLKQAKVTTTLKGHRGQVTGLRFTADSRQLISGADDKTIRIWDPATGKVVRTHEFDLPVTAIDLDSTGKKLAVAIGDTDRPTRKGQVLLIDIDGKPIHPLEGHKKAATDAIFVDGGWLLSASVDQTINVHEVSSGKAHGFFGGHVRPVNAVVAKAGYAISVSGGGAKGKNELRVWKIEDGEELLKSEPHELKVTDVAISLDGSLIATTSEDKTLAVWKAPAKLLTPVQDPGENKTDDTLRIGIIGLDTSHATAFTKMLNGDSKSKSPEFKDCRIMAAYPKGSADIKSSASRIPGYTDQVQKQGVRIVDSIDELLPLVDYVLLETNDGRPHLEQLIPCLKAGKPVFVDKPIAASLTDAIAIFEAARHFKVPVFSSSSLRFSKGAVEIRGGKKGKVLGADAYSPCKFEATHPDLFWYGIHGVETLFTVMGPGCETVTRTTNDTHEVVVGRWKDAGVGTFRGIRKGKSGYGGTVYTDTGIHPIGKYDGYQPLLAEIIKFFRTGTAPVDEKETLEIYAFMEAADESKRQGGKSITLESVMAKARSAAKEKLQKLGIK